MTTPDLFGESPFDAIRQTREDGTEFWSARDLMPLLGYEKWERFEGSIDKATATLVNLGHDVEQEASRLREPSGQTRQMREDVHLSRFAAYLVAMNGDPRKPEVAAAQAYFAVKTREAEVQQTHTLALPKSYAEALRELASTVEAKEQAEARAEIAETQVKELAPAAQAWHDVTNAEGSWSVGDAAKMLRNVGIMTGQNRLFDALDALGWTFRKAGQRHIKQTALDAGLLISRAYAPRYKPNGERIQMAPQIRITGKGLDRLIREGEAA